MVLDRGGVWAVVDDRACRLDVILVGELRLELVLLEPVELGLAADDGSADLEVARLSKIRPYQLGRKIIGLT
jgi:hypothetical protein